MTICLTALLTLMIVSPVTTGAGSSNVKNTVTKRGFQRVVKPDKPINCEDLLANLDHAIIDWMQLKGTQFIMIARRGAGEPDRKLIQARFDYVEDYLKRKGVEYVFAEGSRVEGYGRMEVYVGGRLTLSIPVEKGARRLCWGDTGE